MTAPAPVATRWWAFWLYAAVAIVHVSAQILALEPIVYPTKLLLMPALAAAALQSLRGTSRSGTMPLLLLAIGCSWLGDGAEFFFPFLDDELPAMLLCFGLAHLLYIWIFTRRIAGARVPAWTGVYALWWVGMLVVLWPHLGAFLIPVAIYGLVLGGTAVAAARGGALTAVGGAFFLASDTILAMRLFYPGVDAALSGPAVMITYTIGQGLLVLGLVRLLRRAR